MNMMGNSTIGYFTVMDYDAYTRHVREPNRANAIILTLDAARHRRTQRHDQRRRKAIRPRRHRVLSNFLITEEREEIDGAFAIIVALLMVMTVLLATVGGLGLMGTMSLNVIERTREIGVMRAFGASSAAVFRIVIIEGLLIGMMSWILAIGLSVPHQHCPGPQHRRCRSWTTRCLPSYSPGGILVWAALVIVISIVASLFPALRAVRLTVTQVLAYE